MCVGGVGGGEEKEEMLTLHCQRYIKADDNETENKATTRKQS